MESKAQTTLAAADCEVAFDLHTRRLYATDASIYQIDPLGVAFPRNAAQASAIIRAAADADVPVTPRGSGSGLTGGAIGEGLIIDFSRYNRRITDLNLERGTVRVGAGVVLDSLNAFLQPHKFCFGPDVATSSRATLGGMIANDSSGARVRIHGTTADHVLSLEVVLADGSIQNIGPNHTTLAPQRELAEKRVLENASIIAERMPPGLLKRWPGYGISRFLREPSNLNHLFAGSEGTLAAILSAELRIVPVPSEKGLGIIFFASVADAMQATVDLLPLNPAAIEHIDRILFDQTRGQPVFQAARDMLELDSKPCEAMLIVEFYDDDVPGRLAAMASKRLGLRTLSVRDAAGMGRIWAMRKAGLSLLTGRKGPAKPTTGIEDITIIPERLPAYVKGLQDILSPLHVEACFYGHAASGLLHVRPVLDLHSGEDIRKFRQITDQVSALVRQFKGSLASEHGVGIARVEYMPDHLGSELISVMRDIKSSFDPRALFNPGKIFDPAGRPPANPPYKIDTRLRQGAGYELKLPFEPTLAFAAKDQSFIGNLEQCNGCGGCRKETPTMCPTFQATGEEIMSTRGRANTIRFLLEGRGADGTDPLCSPELDAALSNCLSCKACTTECPSNVNLSLLKAEMVHAKLKREGIPLRARMLSKVDLLGRLGCLVPGVANAALKASWIRRLMERFLGITTQRPLPAYAADRFDRWFQRRGKTNAAAPSKPRGQVILWDDTFVRYHEPHIGHAAVKVLEAAGFEVALLTGRKCCGRPAFSQGNLNEVIRLGNHNLQLFQAQSGPAATAPILFLEPSCYAMFKEEYIELRLPGAQAAGTRCFLFEQFIEILLKREPGALTFKPKSAPIAIHAHCHAKATLNPAFMASLAQRVTSSKAALMDTGCCGMAGAFGALKSKYNLSLQVAEPLVSKIKQQPPGAVIVASGTSCRHQIEHLTPVRPRHLAEVLADAL